MAIYLCPDCDELKYGDYFPCEAPDCVCPDCAEKRDCELLSDYSEEKDDG